MIPLHRPPFGIGTVLASLLTARETGNLEPLEAAHAEASGCADAVWLPSGRAGICWALRAAIETGNTVIAPAFTCAAVHEAIARSGGKIHLLDSVGEDFLLESRALAAAQTEPHALVLSEPYGHAYDLSQLERNAAATPLVRIVDMAMSVPHRSVFERLRGNDFGVISFGAGKSMYAGWGAMGFTRDPSLARAVRKFRDLALSRNTVKLSSQRAAKIFLRTAAHYPAIYSLTRRAYYQGQAVVSRVRKIRQRRPSNEPTQTCIAGFPPDWTAADSHAAEWKLPATRLDGALALWNLKHADSFHAARLELARRYHENLAGAKGIARPKIAQSALSHYTVRVNAVVRNQLKDRLCRAGVYTISLWTFPPHLSPQEFPETARVSSEVVNLPLSPWMSVNQVDWVCELLTRCLAECSLG